jgi:hypothetical protein
MCLFHVAAYLFIVFIIKFLYVHLCYAIIRSNSQVIYLLCSDMFMVLNRGCALILEIAVK